MCGNRSNGCATDHNAVQPGEHHSAIGCFVVSWQARKLIRVVLKAQIGACALNVFLKDGLDGPHVMWEVGISER